MKHWVAGFVLLFVATVFAGCASETKANEAPVLPRPALKASVEGSKVNLEVPGGATDPNPGDELTYHWTWPFGSKATKEPKVQIEMPAGTAKDTTYLFAVVVRDPKGAAASAESRVSFGTKDNNAPMIKVLELPRWVKTGTEVVIDATPTFDGDKDGMTFEWIYGARGAFKESAPYAQAANDPPIEDVQGLHSGVLGPNKAWNLTFDQPGTYTIHCHPHPFMTARIVVDPAQPAAPAEMKIENYLFAPGELKVGLGSTVRFVNLDPAAHTATLMDYTPGSEAGGTTRIFKKSLPEGEYVVRLIVRDVKGGYSTQTWGVKVSKEADAPKAEDPSRASEQPWTVAQGELKIDFNSTTARQNGKTVYFPTNVTATFAWEDPSDQGGPVSGSFESRQSQQSVSGCNLNTVTGEKKLRMTCIVPGAPGDYMFKFRPKAFMASWSFEVEAVTIATPGFGDTGGGDGHKHAH